eukprot:Selendium_serpulae@DN4070_c0_g1_i1.p1
MLISSGIKVTSIASYNHLGNNDGKNLHEHRQFRSKEISKSNVVTDMVAMNRILYPTEEDHPDHIVVIKYVPKVGDEKKALDEYCSSIFLNGAHQLVIHNLCQDSLLAAPVMLDLLVLTELFLRIEYRDAAVDGSQFTKFDTVLSALSFLLKAPVVPAGASVVNALSKQQRAITNILRALVGLPPETDMLLEQRGPAPTAKPLNPKK